MKKFLIICVFLSSVVSISAAERPRSRQRSLTLPTELQLPECSICRDNTYGTHLQTPITLGCQHQFHFGCIAHWFQRNTGCPLCRADSGVPMPPPQEVTHVLRGDDPESADILSMMRQSLVMRQEGWRVQLTRRVRVPQLEQENNVLQTQNNLLRMNRDFAYALTATTLVLWIATVALLYR